MDANEYILTATLGRVLHISLQVQRHGLTTPSYTTLRPKWKIKQRDQTIPLISLAENNQRGTSVQCNFVKKVDSLRFKSMYAVMIASLASPYCTNCFAAFFALICWRTKRRPAMLDPTQSLCSPRRDLIDTRSLCKFDCGNECRWMVHVSEVGATSVVSK